MSKNNNNTGKNRKSNPWASKKFRRNQKQKRLEEKGIIHGPGSRADRKPGWKAGDSYGDASTSKASYSAHDIDPNLDTAPKADKIATNDPSWYMFNAQVAADAGTLITWDRVGTRITDDVQYYNGNPEPVYIPSLMALRFIPTIGENDPSFSGEASVNVQAQAMWKQMQCRIGKDLNFAHSDVSIYLMAMDSLFMLYNYAQRIYLVSNALSPDNISVPQVYYRAMGFPINLPMSGDMGFEEFRKGLNIIGNRINNLKVPTDIKIIERHAWLVSNVFKDADTYKASQYMFVPAGYYTLEDPDTDHIDTWCKYNTITWNSLGGIISDLNHMLDNICNSKFGNEIQARIMLAYKSYFTVAQLPEGQTLVPVFSPEVMPQIHNARICGELDTSHPAGYEGDITQNAKDDVCQQFALQPCYVPGSISTEYKVWGHINYNYGRMIDFLKDVPSIGDNYVATRFTTTGTAANVAPQGQTALWAFVPRWYGTEILTKATIYCGGTAGDVIVDEWKANAVPINVNYSSGWKDWTKIARYLHFDYAPMLFATTDGRASTYSNAPREGEVIGSVVNWHEITAYEIRQLHITAVMGEWLSPADFPTR